MKRRRVAITGIGAVSCIGVGLEAIAASLRAGRSGVRVDPARVELGFLSALAGTVPEFSPRFPLSKKERKTMPDFAVWAHEAVREALHVARFDLGALKSPRAGIIFGNDSCTEASYGQVETVRRLKSTSVLGSGMVFRAMTSTITMNLTSLLGLQGASWTLAGACASGGHAIGQAADLIASDRQDVVLCGGAQENSWEGVCSFDALCAFSTRVDDPGAASRPFDADRDGLVPSGGAAALVLEDWDRARNRGARVLAELLAYSFSADGGHIALTSGEGLARCMAETLDLANVRPDVIDLVSAHGTSTPLGDAAEAEAIKRVFGAAQPWVLSTKSMTGHEMWMSGASQVVYALLMAEGGFIAPNRNFVRPDERTAGLRIPREAVDAAPRFILCNSAGFGGTNSCLLLRAGT